MGAGSFFLSIGLLSGVIIKQSQRFAMAWRSSGNTNAELVGNLEQAGLIHSPRVKAAMLAVDRADFTDHLPYQDSPQGIGYNATISAPHMHAHALQNMEAHLVDGANVLDVGSGSGYLTVCMAKMVTPRGKVVGIEHIDELVNKSLQNIKKHHSDLIKSGHLEVIAGDGRLGHPLPNGPLYNAIHVGAAAESIPQPLIDQLAPGGRMLIPVGKQHSGQIFVQLDKAMDGRVSQKTIEHVLYVPLTNTGAYQNDRVGYALLQVDRADFVDNNPYEDAPQSIGFNATISAPHMHAAAIEALEDHLYNGAKVLDVSPNGKAVGIEHIEELVEKSRENVMKNHKELFEIGALTLLVGDGRLGHPINGGYNAIHVGAASEGIPQPLLDQLAPGGRMVIPVGRELDSQVFLQVDKSEDGRNITQKVIEDVMYVPLTNADQQLRQGREVDAI
ncbi:unnamed protein product, partial [Mesorhabditis spiculigera]